MNLSVAVTTLSFALSSVSSVASAQCTWTVRPGERIQAAIDAAAVSGDTICVGPGTYYGDIDYKGKQIVLRSTQGPDVTTIVGTGTTGAGYLFAAVRFSLPDTGRAVLEGFTVTGGIGGIENCCANPIIRDCIITGNASWAGSGITSYAGNLTIEDCAITWNQGADQDGGGISIQGGFALIADCYIADNRVYTDYYGGGLAVIDGSCVVINTTFARNWSSDGGGAWECPYSCTASLSLYNCRFVSNAVWNNTTGFGSGGGLFGGYATNCYFASNVALGGAGYGGLEGRGGGAARSYLVDCLVTRNLSYNPGGGVAECTLKSATVIHNAPDDIYNSTILP
jgi:hypothetical protein